MMVTKTHPQTLDEFLVFAADNDDQLFEFINGEIIEVSPGRTYNSELRDIITFEVRLFCRDNDLPCRTSGETGSYTIDGHVVAPDLAYKKTPMSKDYPDPNPPLWVVEVISTTDKAKDIRNKRQIYLNAGILYWEVYVETQSVDVYISGEPIKTSGINDVLDAGDILPGFELPLKRLFSE